MSKAKALDLAKLQEQNKQREFKEKQELFLKEYQELTKTHGIDMEVFLNFTPQSISPALRFIPALPEEPQEKQEDSLEKK